MKRGTMCGALIAVGVGTGLLLSAVLAAPRGPGHPCPAGVPRENCTYPPDMVVWRTEWLVGGLLIGVLLAVVAAMVIPQSAEH